MRKNYLAIVLLLGCCFADHARATTVVYIVTPTGIVIGADGKTIPSGTAMKIFLLKRRLVVADSYTESAKVSGGTTTLYDFPTWIEVIDSKIRSNTTVEALSLIIKDEMPRSFSFAIEGIKSGAIKKSDPGVEDILIRYIVAGYESGIPTIYSIWFGIDWDQKTVIGPQRVLVQPEQRQRADSRFGAFGQHVALNQLGDTQSDVHKKAVAKLPLEYQTLAAGKDLTLKQASNFVRGLLAIEAVANPQNVGFPITVVTIPKVGHGWFRTYERDVPALSQLPKGARNK